MYILWKEPAPGNLCVPGNLWNHWSLSNQMVHRRNRNRCINLKSRTTDPWCRESPRSPRSHRNRRSPWEAGRRTRARREAGATRKGPINPLSWPITKTDLDKLGLGVASRRCYENLQPRTWVEMPWESASSRIHLKRLLQVTSKRTNQYI